MKFVKQTTNLGETLASRLTVALTSHRRVVWLVSGGSNIAITIAALQLVDDVLTHKLVIMQTDERFVPLSSPDCNWYQLQQAGFAAKQAIVYPVLAQDESREVTVQRYSDLVKREFTAADYIFGQFGVGTDGHIAGIKPDSVASTATELVCGYQAPDFNRVTLTFPALRQLDEAVVFMFGDAKRPVVEQLADESPPLTTSPAAITREIPVCTIYNDTIESERE